MRPSAAWTDGCDTLSGIPFVLSARWAGPDGDDVYAGGEESGDDALTLLSAGSLLCESSRREELGLDLVGDDC